jgi:hypothetical protein
MLFERLCFSKDTFLHKVVNKYDFNIASLFISSQVLEHAISVMLLEFLRQIILIKKIEQKFYSCHILM